jgi:hypothetical protein
MVLGRLRNYLQFAVFRLGLVEEALDLTTRTGRAMAGMLSVFAEFEREIPRERVWAGLPMRGRTGSGFSAAGFETDSPETPRS